MGIFTPMEEQEKAIVYDPEYNSGYEEFKEAIGKIDVPILNDVPRSKHEIIERRQAELAATIKDAKVVENDGKIRMRSRIHTFLSKELLEELNAVCDREGLEGGNNAKTKMVSSILTKYKVPFMELGTGTNRKAVLIDGYVFKFALDYWGKRDNANEYAMSDVLQPHVVKVYECNDLVAVTEYITLVTYEEFAQNKPTIISILGRLAEEYLLGDVGYHSKNFANWGYRDNGQYVILDFAYIHRIQGHELFCSVCTEGGYLRYDVNFFNLHCSACGHEHKFSDVRAKISTEHELKEINDVKDISFQLRVAEELFDADISDEELKELNNTNKKKAGKNKMFKEEKVAVPFLTGQAAIDDFDTFLNQVNNGVQVAPIQETYTDKYTEAPTPTQPGDTQVELKNNPSILDQLAQVGLEADKKEIEDQQKIVEFLSGEANKKPVEGYKSYEDSYVQEPIDDLIDFMAAQQGVELEDQTLPVEQNEPMSDGSELGMLRPKMQYRKKFGQDKTRLSHQRGNGNPRKGNRDRRQDNQNGKRFDKGERRHNDNRNQGNRKPHNNNNQSHYTKNHQKPQVENNNPSTSNQGVEQPGDK